MATIREIPHKLFSTLLFLRHPLSLRHPRFCFRSACAASSRFPKNAPKTPSFFTKRGQFFGRVFFVTGVNVMALTGFLFVAASRQPPFMDEPSGWRYGSPSKPKKGFGKSVVISLPILVRLAVLMRRAHLSFWESSPQPPRLNFYKPPQTNCSALPPHQPPWVAGTGEGWRRAFGK